MPPQRRRIGCLGQLLALALLAGVGFIALIGFTNPWIFTVGGRFRVLPFWEGVGNIEGPGGTYHIFVFFQPANGGSRILPSTSVRGSGWVCAPTGHTYPVLVGGGANELVWRSMDNKPFGLNVYQRNAGSSVHLPPRLNFRGRWVGPNLVMEDEGTTTSAFLADGSLNLRPGTPGPTRAITFVETRWWWNPCPAKSGASN